MCEALIMVTSAPTFHTAFKNTACLSIPRAAACHQIYIWKHSAPAHSLRLPYEKHPDMKQSCHPLFIISGLEFNFLWISGFGVKPSQIHTQCPFRKCTEGMLLISPCTLWVSRVGGWPDGLEPQRVCAKASNVLFVLLRFGAFSISLTVQILQTIVRGSLLSAIKNSLITHTITLKILDM